ncbi:MAG: GNAT family N-acetyltransferase [Actinobacteria bacterium]|nr:GNAT family N-acetyltransferase [Actinomycetota bacterium]
MLRISTAASSAVGSARVRFLERSLQALTPADLDAWAALADHAVEPNPFFEPEFVTAAAGSPNAVPPRLLILADGGEWIACLPVGTMRRLATTSWRHPYSYAGTPLVAPGHVDDFAATLVAARGGAPDRQFLLLWEAVDAEITAAVRRAADAVGRAEILFERVSERAALARSAEPDAHLAALKPKRRRELARRRQQLAEAFGEEPVVRDRAGDPAAVEEFLHLEAAGWKGREGTAMASAGDSEFFRAACAGFARAGRLQLLSLEAGGETLAMQSNVSAGDTLFGFKMAYDERFRRFAPGIQLEIDAMRIFLADRSERLLDTCADPANEFLNRLLPERRGVTIMVIGPGGLAGAAARRGLDAAYRYRARARSFD